MCLDWVGLWQALVPSGSTRERIPPGEPGANAREPGREGSTSEADVEANDVSSRDGTVIVELLERLSSGDVGCQRDAVKELRILAKESRDRKILIGKVGSIPLLVELLRNRDPEVREHAVTTLLNLSIINANKEAIVHAGAIDAITEVLRSGSMEARENSAATLFSLSVLDENKVVIGKSGALPPLVDLLRDGTMRGRHDAASVLFNLSLLEENGPTLVSAGILPPLVELLGEPAAGMVDVSLEILSLLVANEDCTSAVGDASTIPILIDFLKSGSPGNKENAVVVLLALTQSDPAQANLVRHLGALSHLVEIAKCGTPRSRRKASELLDSLRKMEHDSQ